MERRAIRRFAIASVAAGFVWGCNKPEPPPASQPTSVPASQPVASQPAVTQPVAALLPASYEWTITEALSHIGDADAAVSAAVRLVRLGQAEEPCLPEKLSPELFDRLVVLPVEPYGWVLGRETETSTKLAAPILITLIGEITIIGDCDDLAGSAAFVADDPEVFPNLLLTPGEVAIVGERIIHAIVADDLAGLSFAHVDNEGYPFVVLSRPGEGEAPPREVARYTWDPYELAFMGPVCDVLPNPPGGEFKIDLPASEALIPVGGKLPEPPPPPMLEKPEIPKSPA